MMKIVKWGLFITVLGVLIWYFFFKEYDYQINFETKTTIGTVNQSLKSWNSSLENPQEIVQLNEAEFLQIIKNQESTYELLWKLKNTNDSTVKVSAFVKDEENLIKNRILIPFSEPTIEKIAKHTVKEFLQSLQKHLKEIRIQIEGEDTSPNTFAAYVSVNCLQIEKAKGMMANFNLLSSFIDENKLEANGRPFLEITHWDREKDSVSYNFCFPFKKTDSIRGNTLISMKAFPSKKSLKAIYNGNYITSDRAWYALAAYAQKNNREVDMLPIEVFHNNPNMGGDELQWKTEVYLPLKEE
ncbi:MAG: GyrI-like domain-containing protein [Flavobacteriaceae bacterium]